MATITEEQQRTLTGIWEKHTEGATKTALFNALTAAGEEEIRLHEVQDEANDYWRQLAIMIVTLANTAARRSARIKNFRGYLKISLDWALRTFPLSGDQKEAREAGGKWTTVFASISSGPEYVKHLLNLVELIQVISSDEELRSLAVGLRETLMNAPSTEEMKNRAKLIDQIKKGQLKTADQALDDFIEFFGANSLYNQVTESTDLASILRGRYLVRGRFHDAERILAKILTIRAENDEFSGTINKQIRKGARAPITAFALRAMIRTQLLVIRNEPDLVEMIKTLESQQWIGLPPNQVGNLKTGEIS